MRDGAYPPGVTGKMIDELDNPNCCGNCIHYNGSYCTRMWNNMDEDYKTDEDEKEPEDYCDDWEWDGEDE